MALSDMADVICNTDDQMCKDGRPPLSCVMQDTDFGRMAYLRTVAKHHLQYEGETHEECLARLQTAFKELAPYMAIAVDLGEDGVRLLKGRNVKT